MGNISDYLSALMTQKNNLANNLNAMGINVNTSETLNSLVPKVLQIENSSGIDKKLYSFGVLSDVHIKYTDGGELDNTNSKEKFKRALGYYDDNGAEFICIPGDILAHNREFRNPDNPHTEEYNKVSEGIWIEELLEYKRLGQAHFEGDIYECTGNHDVSALGHFEHRWEGHPFVGMDYVITTEDPKYAQYHGRTCLDIWQEIIGDLHYVVERNDDVFIFFSMYYWHYRYFCRNEDIDWLSQKLEQHKDKRVFLFSHMPSPEYFDGPAYSTGLQIEYGRGLDFKKLVDKYPNTIFFSGHTHYELRLEEEYENPNTYFNPSSMSQVHCSSCAYTRYEVDFDADVPYRNAYEESEGYIVDVYENKIVVSGINFEVNDGAMMPIVKYIINK